eukprot:3107766-Rhodomonas_salina.1
MALPPCFASSSAAANPALALTLPLRARAGQVTRLRGGGNEQPRYAWDQNKEEVQLYVFLDDIGSAWGGEPNEAFEVDFQPLAFHFRAKNFGGHDWSLTLQPLHAKINVQTSFFKVRKDRVSIKLKKEREGAVWPKLLRVEHLTMDDIPPLPEAWRIPEEEAGHNKSVLYVPDEEHNSSSHCAPADATSGAEGGGGGGEGEKAWEAMGSGEKLEIMNAERKSLEALLTAAQHGDLPGLREQVLARARKGARRHACMCVWKKGWMRGGGEGGEGGEGGRVEEECAVGRTQ